MNRAGSGPMQPSPLDLVPDLNEVRTSDEVGNLQGADPSVLHEPIEEHDIQRWGDRGVLTFPIQPVVIQAQTIQLARARWPRPVVWQVQVCAIVEQVDAANLNQPWQAQFTTVVGVGKASENLVSAPLVFPAPIVQGAVLLNNGFIAAQVLNINATVTQVPAGPVFAPWVFALSAFVSPIEEPYVLGKILKQLERQQAAQERLLEAFEFVNRIRRSG